MSSKSEDPAVAYSLAMFAENREVSSCDCNSLDKQVLSKNCVNHKNCPELYCDLCSYKTNRNTVSSHFQSDKHNNRYKRLHEYLYLMSLLPPTNTQYKKLTESIEKFALAGTLNDEDIRTRWIAVSRFNDILSKISPNCTVRVYGSTINGFGLKWSDINIELVRRDGEDILESSGELLERISQYISQCRGEVTYSGIVDEFDLKTPRLHFVESVKHQPESQGLHFELSVTAEKSWKTSNLLQCYSIFDKRARILGLTLRKWAYAFKFDNQENGTWPAHAFPILVIHYLQRTDPPVLPCFHEILQEKMTQKFAPENKESNEEDTSNDLSEDDIANLQQTWKSRNTKTVGELLIGLFKYYILDFQCGTNVVSIRKTTKFDSHSSKGWGTKILAIEDPSRPSCNLSRSVGNIKIYEIFMEAWRNTYKYLLTPHTREKPCFLESDFMFKIRSVPSKLQKCSLHIERVKSEAAKGSDAESDDENAQDNNNKTSVFELKKLIADYGLYYSLNPDIEKFIRTLKKDDFYYNFNFHTLGLCQPTPKFCRLCHKTGHNQSNCPIERLPELVQIPEQMPEMHKWKLNHICEELYLNQRLDKDDETRYCTILLSLARFIKNSFPESNLELFGSTKNGFGRRDCDLDICLTFKSNPTGEGIDQADVIKQLAELLKDHDCVANLEPITQAKVPILKFRFTSIYNSNKKICECDISLYNLLAVENTKLLKTYCELDERVSRLGFIVKHFAKTCDICDASRGSLSSYAYTLMTLHYLQQCQPPVIPVLQELYNGEKPEKTLDNWNVWFFDDVNALPRSKNTLSVAELFVGFLRYYSESFDFHKYVVCVNQFQPLTKLKKMWTGKRIAIEDPFLLTHNLGQGVDDHMAAFIKTAICKGRNLIGNPPHELPPRYKDWCQYFFDRDRLTEGSLPTGRGCRNCGKIGHKRADCPFPRGRRQPQQNQHRQRQQQYQRQHQHEQSQYHQHQQPQYSQQQQQQPRQHQRYQQHRRNENGHSHYQNNAYDNQYNAGGRGHRQTHWQQNSTGGTSRGYRPQRNS